MKHTFLILLFTSLAISAEEVEKNTLPDKADKILQSLNQDIIEIKKKSLIQLDKVLSDEMKKGNLEDANLIKKERDRIAKEIKGESPDANWFLGQWRADMGAMYELKADNVCTVNGQITGKYTVDEKTIKMTWPNGYVDSITKVGESKFIMSNNVGQKFGIKKL